MRDGPRFVVHSGSRRRPTPLPSPGVAAGAGPMWHGVPHAPVTSPKFRSVPDHPRDGHSRCRDLRFDRPVPEPAPRRDDADTHPGRRPFEAVDGDRRRARRVRPSLAAARCRTRTGLARRDESGHQPGGEADPQPLAALPRTDPVVPAGSSTPDVELAAVRTLGQCCRLRRRCGRRESARGSVVVGTGRARRAVPGGDRGTLPRRRGRGARHRRRHRHHRCPCRAAHHRTVAVPGRPVGRRRGTQPRRGRSGRRRQPGLRGRPWAPGPRGDPWSATRRRDHRTRRDRRHGSRFRRRGGPSGDPRGGRWRRHRGMCRRSCAGRRHSRRGLPGRHVQPLRA